MKIVDIEIRYLEIFRWHSGYFVIVYCTIYNFDFYETQIVSLTIRSIENERSSFERASGCIL